MPDEIIAEAEKDLAALEDAIEELREAAKRDGRRLSSETLDDLLSVWGILQGYEHDWAPNTKVGRHVRRLLGEIRLITTGAPL